MNHSLASLLIIIILSAGGCGGGDTAQNPEPQPAPTPPTPPTPAPVVEKPAAPVVELKPENPVEAASSSVKAATEKKFQSWLLGANHDYLFEGVELRGSRLLDFQIKAVVPVDSPDPANNGCFYVISTVEVESRGNSPIKRQLKHLASPNPDGSWRFIIDSR